MNMTTSKAGEIIALNNVAKEIEPIAEKKLSEGEYKVFKKDLDDLKKMVPEYALTLTYSINARENNINALKAKKIDPYIVGGAMSGAFGGLSGVAAGIDQHLENQSIDQWREKAQTEMFHADAVNSMIESQILATCDRVLKTVKRYPEMNTIFTNELTRVEKESAEKQKKEKNPKATERLFTILMTIGFLLTAVWYIPKEKGIFLSMLVCIAGGLVFTGIVAGIIYLFTRK